MNLLRPLETIIDILYTITLHYSSSYVTITTWTVLIVLRISGVFKGYGFACFHNKVSALQARHVLDGQTVGGHTVDCGWLKEGSHSLAELHSKVG